MKWNSQQGFSLIEMIVVTVAVGIIGSLAASMLFQGADIYVDETKRQGFISEARSAFWRLQRDTQSQARPQDFAQSEADIVYVTNAAGEQKNYQLGSNGSFTLEKNSTSYTLSSAAQRSNSTFQFYNSSYTTISPASSGMTPAEAEAVHLAKLTVAFAADQDTINLSTWVFPENFRFGTKMSYHE
jgi:prepilin-type N-terminal cleavage/methylation domain-containing protein